MSSIGVPALLDRPLASNAPAELAVERLGPHGADAGSRNGGFVGDVPVISYGKGKPLIGLGKQISRISWMMQIS